LIDQHAAHERAIYEELTEKLKNKESVSQLLVVPVVLKLTQKQKLTLEENKEKLEELGFELDEFGVDTYALRAVPCVFNSPGNAGFFIDILDTLADRDISNIYETQLDAIATMSCKAAVKGNDRLSYTEAEALIQKLLKLENPFTCPHGRPTIIEMSKYELEKKFKRIQ
jgi:DNA mismatch repair protein MutL